MIFVVPLFIISIFVAPWWVIMPLGITVLTLPFGVWIVVPGALVLDYWYGIPIHPLFGLEYLYTIFFLFIFFAQYSLSRRIL